MGKVGGEVYRSLSFSMSEVIALLDAARKATRLEACYEQRSDGRFRKDGRDYTGTQVQDEDVIDRRKLVPGLLLVGADRVHLEANCSFDEHPKVRNSRIKKVAIAEECHPDVWEPGEIQEAKNRTFGPESGSYFIDGRYVDELLAEIRSKKGDLERSRLVLTFDWDGGASPSSFRLGARWDTVGKAA